MPEALSCHVARGGRVAAADDVWLSTAYGRQTANVAIHQYAGLPYQEYFRAFESIAAPVGGRPHWGELHTLDAGRLSALYPRFADFLRVRDEADPQRRFGSPYLAPVLGYLPAPHVIHRVVHTGAHNVFHR